LLSLHEIIPLSDAAPVDSQMPVSDQMSSDKSAVGISLATKIWRSFWMIAACAAALGIVFSLVRPTYPNAQIDHKPGISPEGLPEDLVQVTGPGQILVRTGTPLAKNLGVVTVEKKTVSYPLLTVTGSVAARIRPGTEPLEERWQFANADIASAYADWLKSKSDITFNESQLKSTRDLTKAQVDRFEAVASHLRAAATGGGIAGKDLRAAEADLVQAKLQGQKDVFAAETSLRMAMRQRSALERQLSQAGIEPVVFSRARDFMVLISANVPEARMSLVEQGQACSVQFYGIPENVYSAHVEEIGSVLSTERRTLRVLFDLTDEKDQLKPGMFAEVGLGTNEREALVIPANATLHIGRSDYVFKQASDGQHYEVTEVKLSESRNEHVEVLEGLKQGERIAGTEAVLLKPLAVQSLAKQFPEK
jgi:membrane fusion protein, heavy metal efflux system